MRILDRYIIKSTLKVFLGCILTFLFLYIIIDIFGHLDEILQQKTPLFILKQYYFSYLPIIFVQVAPVASLLATLYCLGDLSRHNELIAMRTSGLSIFRITQGLLILGVVISLIVFLMNEKITPSSLVLVDQIKNQIQQNSKNENEEKRAIKNLSVYGLKNRLFFVNKFSIADNSMYGITILEQDRNHNVTKKIVANKGEWQEGLWRFYQSLTYNFEENGQIKGEPQYLEEEIMDITESPQDFLKQRQNPQFMNIALLNDYIMRLSRSGAKSIVRNFKVDLYHRFTFPFTNLVIIVVGIPFAMRIRGRATALASFGISFAVGFIYYVSDAIALAFGKAGILPPFLAASAGHLFFLGLGIYLILELT